MIEKISKLETLNFTDLSEEEKTRRGILGILYGPIADIVRPTRNGRKYSESLWSKVFDKGLPKELLNNGGIPGELDHPEGRTETCPDRIAIMMPEKPKKDDTGHLIARFDIISTPCGQIAYSLAKYGFKLGVSSRGDGSVNETYDGIEEVDPDDYELSAFDLVLVPACEQARLNLMTESLDKNKQEFKQSLTEALNKATPAEKQIMTETLDRLKIDYHEDVNTETGAAIDDGALVEDLQKSLSDNKQLQKQIQELQEKLSVSYAKELKLEESVSKYKSAIVQLGEGSRQCKALKQQLAGLTTQLEEKSAQLTKQQKLFTQLTESRKFAGVKQTQLQESLTAKTEKIVMLEKQVQQLTESVKQLRTSSVSIRETLEESNQEIRKNSAIKQKELTEKLTSVTALVEKYKRIAATAVDKYIESKAVVIGVTPSEIKSRLSENYSFKDIDNVCEKLMTLSINVTKLPVELTTKSVSMKATSSMKESIKPIDRTRDDEIDNQLLRLAGIDE